MMEKQWLVGIDIGGTSIKLAFLTDQGEVLHKWEIATNKANQGSGIIDEIAASVHAKLDELNLPHSILSGAGVGAPGPVDVNEGLLFEAVNIGWEDRFPLRDLLQNALKIPVAIENDANSAALGEMWKGAGNGAKDLICITLGTGVGGGVIVNGDIVHGSKGAAGEVGHITAVANDGYLCNCGKKGCLETVASATGIVRSAIEKIGSYDGKSELKEVYERKGKLTAKDIFDAANLGDALALDTIDTFADHLGLALANIGSVFNPEKIVVGGGVSNAGNLVLDPIKKHFKKYAFKPVGESTEIVLAQLGNDAGITGAAWLAANKL